MLSGHKDCFKFHGQTVTKLAPVDEANTYRAIYGIQNSEFSDK
jgi:hypothetical protein